MVRATRGISIMVLPVSIRHPTGTAVIPRLRCPNDRLTCVVGIALERPEFTNTLRMLPV